MVEVRGREERWRLEAHGFELMRKGEDPGFDPASGLLPQTSSRQRRLSLPIGERSDE